MADFVELITKFSSTGFTRVGSELDGMYQKASKAGRATDDFTASLHGLSGVALATGAAIGSVGLALSSITKVTREFEVLNAGLKTATGSAERAEIAFDVLCDFAKRTPYDLQQTVTAFTKLVNYGLTPSERALYSYGNTASAMFKSLDQMVEAVADAITGEFERLKEFGIKASKEGDKVTFTFRGIKTTVKNSAKEIEDYLIKLGEMNFDSAMSDRMSTLDGALSNLNDSWVQIIANISDAGVGDLITDFIKSTSSGLESLNKGFESGEAVEYLGDIKTILLTLIGLYGGFKLVSSDTAKAIGRTFKQLYATKEVLMIGHKADLAEAQGALERFVAQKNKTFNGNAFQKVSPTVLSGWKKEMGGWEEKAGKASKALTDLSTKPTLIVAASEAGTRALSGLSGGAKSLVAFLGGPWGIAFTVATAGITYLLSRQDEGVTIGKRYEKVSSSIEEALKKQASAAQGASEKTKDLSTAQQKLAASQAFEDQATALQAIQSLSTDRGWLERLGVESAAPGIDAIREKALELLTAIRTGTGDVTKIAKEIDKLGTSSDEAATLASSILKWLFEAEKAGKMASGQFQDTEKSVWSLQDAAKNAKSELASGWIVDLSSVDKGINQIEKKIRLMKAETLGGKAFASVASFLPKDMPLEKAKQVFDSYKSGPKLEEWQRVGQMSAVFGVEAAKSMDQLFTLGIVEEQTEKKLDAYRKSRREATKDHSSEIKSATERIQQYREEISRLNGTDTSSTTSLAKTMREIAEQGDKAKMSANDIKSLQEQYKSAFRADTIRDFNKELLTAQGRASEIRKIEIDETVNQWKQQFIASGDPAEIAAVKVAELRAELEKASTIKDLQTAADFYQKLADLSGNYNATTEYQNQLLEAQARIYAESLGPGHEKYIEQWKELMQLQNSRDYADGITRGLKKWTGEYTNMAMQMEGFTTSTLDAMTEGLLDFTSRTSASFSDMTRSILQDLARITARMAMAGLIKTAVGFFSAPGGGTATASVSGNSISGGWAEGFMSRGSSYAAIVKHGGGMALEPSPTRRVPASFFEGAPRYHTGFINPAYERAAIIRTDESVLTPGQMKAIAGAGGASVVNNIAIVPPEGYEGKEARTANATGGEDIRVTFGRIAAQQANTYGSELNVALRRQGTRMPVMRSGG